MKEELISLETSKLAKEKGFDWKVCNAFVIRKKKIAEEDSYYYNHNGSLNLSPLKDNSVSETISRPTQSSLQKWLREEHNLHIYVDTTPTFGDMKSHKSKYKSLVKVPFQPFKWTTGKYYLGDTYEEALERGLFEALKLIK